MNQQSAQGLASLGRGPDSMLVHMAPGEVNSLQQLAMAHGGSLTINPETGLPEAGFLSSILPMVLGAGAMMIPGLQGVGAAGIGLGLGGLEALRTGSLKKGLMAGFGAYGGAGLGAALAGAGGANMAAAGGVNAANLAGPAVPSIEAFNPSNVTASAGQKMLAGAQGLGSEAGRNAFMSQIGGAKGLGMAGLAAAAPMMMQTTTQQPEIKTDKDMGQRYQFSAGAPTPTPPADVPGYGDQSQNFGKEQRYFNPRYTPIDNDAARRLYGFAYGGPVEDMSNGNDMAAYMGQDKFAEGGGVDSYTYDPVTQMYVKKGGEGATMVSPTGGISGASAGAGGSDDQPLSPQTLAFLENEAKNPGARDARMQGISDLLSLAVPGGMAARALSGALSSSTAGQIANFFDPPGSQPNYGVPVDSRGMSANNPMGQTSYESGVGNPAEQGSDTGGGAGIGGGDISGQSEGTPAIARGGLLAQGGISHLGDYSDGGRLLRGPGDGISDSIPATIGKKRPARLADGEFVVPARIVSELGNGSTEAGARKLYAMMDRIQKARKKTIGKGKVAANSRSAKYLPA